MMPLLEVVKEFLGELWLSLGPVKQGAPTAEGSWSRESSKKKQKLESGCVGKTVPSL